METPEEGEPAHIQNAGTQHRNSRKNNFSVIVSESALPDQREHAQ